MSGSSEPTVGGQADVEVLSGSMDGVSDHYDYGYGRIWSGRGSRDSREHPSASNHASLSRIPVPMPLARNSSELSMSRIV